MHDWWACLDGATNQEAQVLRAHASSGGFIMELCSLAICVLMVSCQTQDGWIS